MEFYKLSVHRTDVVFNHLIFNVILNHKLNNVRKPLNLMSLIKNYIHDE